MGEITVITPKNEGFGFPWRYNLYKWPYKWVTGVITLHMGVITPYITGFLGPPCRWGNDSPLQVWCHAGSGVSSSPPSNFAGPGGGRLENSSVEGIERKHVFRLFEI